MTVDHHEAMDLLPLLALDALEGDERRAIEDHVESCAICVAELEELRAAAASLVPDEEAPEHIWSAIEARIGATVRPGDPTPTEVERPAAPMSTAPTAVGSARAPSRTRGIPWTIVSIAASFAIAAVGVLAWLRAPDPLVEPDDIALAAAEAAELPGAVTTALEVDGKPVAEVVISPEGFIFFVPGDDLQPLTPDRAYQLWVVTPDEKVISAGLIGADPEPAAFTWRGPVAALALTREVAGGVPVSEGDVVAVAPASGDA